MKKMTSLLSVMAGMLFFLASSISMAGEFLYQYDIKEKKISQIEKGNKGFPLFKKGDARSHVDPRSALTVCHFLSSSMYLFAVPDEMEFELVLGQDTELALYRLAIWDEEVDYPDEKFYPWIKTSVTETLWGVFAIKLEGYQDTSGTNIFKLKGVGNASQGFTFYFSYIPREKFVAFCLGNQEIISQLPVPNGGQKLFFSVLYVPYLTKISIGEVFSLQGVQWHDYQGNSYRINVLQVIMPNGLGFLSDVYHSKPDQEILITDGQAIGLVYEGVPYVE